MGQSGSDVAKDSSDIVLSDDNFASIVAGIEEGRRMFDNIQKFILHVLAENVALAIILLAGLAFIDKSGSSVFPQAPVEIVWIIMITSGFPDMGLGVERPVEGILRRHPKTHLFTKEVMVDMVVYGVWTAVLCMVPFLIVIYGFGGGNLGQGCNDGYSAACDVVFRARGTTFACLTWFTPFLAWEMVDMRRSLFWMHPNTDRRLTQWMVDVWSNQFLFWSVVASFISPAVTLYVPVLNHKVFKHTGISWEWGVVLVATLLFFAGCEFWKWMKRVYFRRRVKKINGAGGAETEVEERLFETSVQQVSGDEKEASTTVQAVEPKA